MPPESTSVVLVLSETAAPGARSRYLPESMTDTSDDGLPRFSAAALQEWGRNVESVIRGISHALNNRAAALSAVIELSRDPIGDDAAAVNSILRGELLRVGELAQVIRTIGTPRHGEEAFAPKDAALDSLAALQLHIEHRDRLVIVDATSASPVRTHRWMFVRALIALGSAASNGTTGAAARIVITDDGDWVMMRVDGVRTPAAQLSPYAGELAHAMGGEPLENGCGFRLPSLSALRRREAR